MFGASLVGLLSIYHDARGNVKKERRPVGNRRESGGILLLKLEDAAAPTNMSGGGYSLRINRINPYASI